MNSKVVFDRAPRRIYWEVTRACDLACRHCRAEAVPEREPGELSTGEAGRLLDRLAAFDSPAIHLVLTGGDPLKRPDLFELIERGRMKGLGVSVAPSGTPLLTSEVIAAFKQSGVEAISLSLDGSTAARHDALRGVPGCFARTVDAARAAAEVGLPFQMNTLVSDETLHDLPAIYGVACDLGAARWSLFLLVSVGRGAVLNAITPDACEQLFGWLAGAAIEGGPVVTTTEAPHFRRVVIQRRQREVGLNRRAAHPVHDHAAGIRDGNGIMFISYKGDVSPSGFLPLCAGNVRRDDPIDIYRSSPLFRGLRDPDGFGGRCGACEFRWVCGGSRARAFAASGDPLAEDPLCRFQPARRERERGTFLAP